MVLLGIGAGTSLPGADDAGDVGRDAERRGPGLRAGQHHRAGRRRARPRRAGDAVVHPHAAPRRRQGGHEASALTSGYHLAFLIGAGCVVAAIGVALTVLRPEGRAQAGAEASGAPAQADASYSEAA